MRRYQAHGAAARGGLGGRRRRRPARAVHRGARSRASPPEDALRLAVAAGAASTLEVGAGRFDPREAGRLRRGRRARRARLGRLTGRPRTAVTLTLLGEEQELVVRARSSAVKASPSTTSCSCRPSRPCCRTTCARATRLTRTIALEIPIVSAAMDTVTEARLAIALAREGGIGILHRNLSIADQVAEVDKVKRSESGMIVEPVTLRARRLRRRRARADGALPHLRRPDHRRGRRPRRDPHQPRPPLRVEHAPAGLGADDLARTSSPRRSGRRSTRRARSCTGTRSRSCRSSTRTAGSTG